MLPRPSYDGHQFLLRPT